jgi:DNA-directed RNA polymerase subunit delta
LQKLPLEDRKELSLIEIAQYLLAEKKQAMSFQDLLAEIAHYLELSDEEMRSRMLQFYTDLNVDGRFLALGENRWGLREWYPFDQVDEEIVAPVKVKKKKAKQYDEDEDLADLEEDDLDYDLDLDEADLDEDESLEALREEEEAEYDEEDLLDDVDYDIEDDEEEELDLEEEEED